MGAKVTPRQQYWFDRLDFTLCNGSYKPSGLCHKSILVIEAASRRNFIIL